jgi:hypothetical protein
MILFQAAFANGFRRRIGLRAKSPLLILGFLVFRLRDHQASCGFLRIDA